MLRFRIYYADGSTWAGDPFYAPARGVQVIAQEGETAGGRGFGLIHSKDFYVWKDEGGWFGVNDGGFWEYLLTHEGPLKVLHGWTMAKTPEFHECVRRADREGLA